MLPFGLGTAAHNELYHILVSHMYVHLMYTHICRWMISPVAALAKKVWKDNGKPLKFETGPFESKPPNRLIYT